MGTLVMQRRAADNPYMHKDFHAALNCGIRYLAEHYGEAAVIDYLRAFSRQWYAPLHRALLREGLEPVCRHIVAVHRAEGVEVEIETLPDGVIVHIPLCPAVHHIRSSGGVPSELFVETTTTVNHTLCEGTAYGFELLAYDTDTGRSTQHFFRRPL